jgi:hypothetical protein
VFHFGIGLAQTVDVRVTFPNGQQTIRTGVARNSRIEVQPTVGQPPIAAIAAPASASVGQLVTFDGTGSVDPDGTITQYAWDFGDGAIATGATATHAYAAPGTFVARLTVTDNTGATGTATATITVIDTTPPTIAFGSAVFTPTVSSDVVRVEWYFDGALAATTTTPPFTYTLNLTPIAGSHTLTPRAFDAAGNATDAAPVMLVK